MTSDAKPRPLWLPQRTRVSFGSWMPCSVTVATVKLCKPRLYVTIGLLFLVIGWLKIIRFDKHSRLLTDACACDAKRKRAFSHSHAFATTKSKTVGRTPKGNGDVSFS